VFGIAPPCDDCELPRLSPVNRPAWEIWLTLDSGFCQDFGVDVFKVMELYQVKQPARMLRQLAQIYGIARKNAEKNDGK